MSALPSLPSSVTQAASVDLEHARDHVDSSAATNGYTNGTSSSSSHPTFHLAFQLPDQPIDHARPLKVIVIGAGFSGIYFGIRIPQRLRNVDLVIYEKNEGVGGTWYENTYPGVACDIPSHSYQYSFNPNTQWSALYAPGAEIQAYLAATAEKYSVGRFLKLSHKVEECRWDEDEGKWYVKVQDLASGQRSEDTCDILVNARGGLNEKKWPDFEGFGEFKGEIMHSAAWHDTYDFTNKRIGIIGSGSSSIQIVPKLQSIANTHLSVFVRNRTWISPPFGSDLWDELGVRGTELPEALRAKFAADPAVYEAFRLRLEEGGNGIHSVTQQDSAMLGAAKEHFAENMRARLKSRPDIFEKLLPQFSPGCRRLTPGEGYLEALTQENVDFVSNEIARLEENGIRTGDGTLHALDALICATGFYASSAPPFHVLGRDGTPLADHWKTYPRTYLGLATDRFPNLFGMLWPNSAIGSGSLTVMLEATGDYIVRCVRKVQKERIRAMVPKAARVDDFVDVARAYFRGTVFAEECRSWYKNARGEVTGLWPGSTLHCLEVLRSPRWEDFEYEYEIPGGSRGGRDGDKGRVNALAFMGNGWTTRQLEGRDLAWYLYPRFMDEPSAPRPEEGGECDVRLFTC